MSERTRRHAELRRLIGAHRLRSHSEVRDALAEAGLEVHPATISRDLEELGARKLRGEDGQLAYRLADAPTLPSDTVDDVLARFVVAIDASGNLAVLRTPPACAHPVASAIDGARLPGVIATVAGDDTVLVVAAEGVHGADLARTLAARVGLDADRKPDQPAAPSGAARNTRPGGAVGVPDRQGA